MIPLRDNIPTRRAPVITFLLIAVNVVVFVFDRLNGQVLTVNAGDHYARVFVGAISEHYAMVPAFVTQEFSEFGLTILTSMFLHANWLHIGGNMLYLWIFGNNVEDTLGRPRFLLFYLLCGVAAAAVHIGTDPGSEIPTVGASGAVAGLMGAYLVLFPRAEILAIVPLFVISTFMEVPAILVIGFWVLLQFVNANWMGGGEMTGGGVAYFAHIGGFAAGIVLILMLGGKRLLLDKVRPYYDDRYLYP
jgi:membrane associated rhomboid family serine protease